MAVSLRIGLHGSYYGNDFDSSNPLSQEQMNVNATYIYNYLITKGWTINAIAGILGNMQAESSINPGRWQSDRVGGDTEGHGYGLCQWTPYTKYTEWVNGDPSTMDNNLLRISYEVDMNQQWIPKGAWSDMTFKEFTTSTLTPEELGAAFVICYERPADQSEEVQRYRGSLAAAWFTYLGGITPSKRTKNKKFNFVLFNRRRLKRG